MVIAVAILIRHLLRRAPALQPRRLLPGAAEPGAAGAVGAGGDLQAAHHRRAVRLQGQRADRPVPVPGPRAFTRRFPRRHHRQRSTAGPRPAAHVGGDGDQHPARGGRLAVPGVRPAGGRIRQVAPTRDPTTPSPSSSRSSWWSTGGRTSCTTRTPCGSKAPFSGCPGSWSSASPSTSARLSRKRIEHAGGHKAGPARPAAGHRAGDAGTAAQEVRPARLLLRRHLLDGVRDRGDPPRAHPGRVGRPDPVVAGSHRGGRPARDRGPLVPADRAGLPERRRVLRGQPGEPGPAPGSHRRRVAHVRLCGHRGGQRGLGGRGHHLGLPVALTPGGSTSPSGSSSW